MTSVPFDVDGAKVWTPVRVPWSSRGRWLGCIMPIVHVLESVLYAEDLVAARTFYVEVLGLPEILFDASRHLFLRCDDSVLIVFRASKTKIDDADVPPHGAVGVGHLAFSASILEIDVWRDRLQGADIPIVKEIQWPNGAYSIYFNDPAGNVLEFATPSLWFSFQT